MRALISVVLCGLLAGLLVGCSSGSSGGSGGSPTPSGSSSATGNAAACEKVAADARSLSSLQRSATNKQQALSALESLREKLGADVNVGSPQLQSGVRQIVSLLSSVTAQLRSGKTPDIGSLFSRLGKAEHSIQQACGGSS